MAFLLQSLKFYAFTGLFWASMLGFGLIVTRTLVPLQPRRVGLTTVFGLGAVSALGGLLNMVYMARGFVLDGLLLIGLASALFELKGALGRRAEIAARARRHSRWLSYSALWLGALLVILAISSLIPEVYNAHDDYQKYFNLPVRMLSTGSVFGSPLSCVGKDVLGGQALFQGFFVRHLGLAGMNVFDSVFCLLVAVVLLLEESFRRGAPGLGLLAASLFVLIHPQYVNTSALYSAALFMCASVFLSADLAKASSESRGLRAPLVGLALFYAALVALKSSYAPFSAVHMLLLFVLTIRERSARFAIGLAGGVTALSLALALPWFSWSLKGLAAPLDPADPWSLGMIAEAVREGMSTPSPQDRFGWGAFFSLGRGFYGGPALAYTSLSALGGCVGAFALFRILRRAGADEETASPTSSPSGEAPRGVGDLERPRGDALALGAGGIAAALVSLVVVGVAWPRLFFFITTLRYLIPFLIGIVPACLVLAHVLARASRAGRYVFPALCLLGCLVFFSEAGRRWSQGLQYGSTLAFSTQACLPEYRNYSQEVLGGVAAERAAKWQSAVPAGAPVVVWSNHAFLFDFARNPIFQVEDSGLMTPWAAFPDADYLIWDHSGYASPSPEGLKKDIGDHGAIVRRIRLATLAFYQLLEEREGAGQLKVIYQDATTKVYRVER